MPSPATPSQFCAAVPAANADLCTRFSRFLSVIQYLCDFFSWMLDSDGSVSDAFTNEIVAKIIPAGTIAYSVASSMGSGWLAADGSEVSRTTYSTLFAAIGTRYGAGNGTTTFRLPDLRGRSPIGAGKGLLGGTLTTRDIDTIYVGSETQTLTTEQIPPHTHDYLGPTTRAQEKGTGANIVWSGVQTVQTESTGTGTPVNIVHPCFIAYPFIKT